MTQHYSVAAVAQAAYGMLLQLEEFSLRDDSPKLFTGSYEAQRITRNPIDEEQAELLEAIVEELQSLKSETRSIQTQLDVCRALLRHLSGPYGRFLPVKATWLN